MSRSINAEFTIYFRNHWAKIPSNNFLSETRLPSRNKELSLNEVQQFLQLQIADSVPLTRATSNNVICNCQYVIQENHHSSTVVVTLNGRDVREHRSKYICAGAACVAPARWRGRRDLNSCGGFPPYRFSRPIPSASWVLPHIASRWRLELHFADQIRRLPVPRDVARRL